MDFKDFCAENLIFGTTLIAQSFQLKVKKNLSVDSRWSFIGSLVLIALYYEGRSEGMRPSQLARTIGLGSRPNVEISVLTKHGYIQKVQNQYTRETTLFLTSLGEQKALEILEAFEKLQGSVNRSIGSDRAQELNTSLVSLHGTLNESGSSPKQNSQAEDVAPMND